MQHSDERPPTSGRPSLLSTEQQAEADRHRILGTLDDKLGAAPAGPRGQRKYSWLAAGLVAVVAIGAGSAFWLNGEGEKEIVLASSAPLPAAPAAAAPLVTEPVPVNPEADEVSTAAILQDVPAGPAKPAAGLQDKPAPDDLTSLLEGPSGEPSAAEVAAPIAAAGVAAQPAAKAVPLAPKAPARPAPDKSPAEKPAPVKAAARPAPVKIAGKPAPKTAQKKENRPAQKTAVAAAPAKKKAEAPAKPVDTDVTLLAALVAHSKATQSRKAVTPADKLRQCKTLGSVAAAEQCRARLCAAGAKNEAECKAPRLAKASAEQAAEKTAE